MAALAAAAAATTTTMTTMTPSAVTGSMVPDDLPKEKADKLVALRDRLGKDLPAAGRDDMLSAHSRLQP